MAEQRQQHRDRAREYLSKAKEWIAHARKSQTTEAGKEILSWSRLPWNERLALEFLEREAVQLVEGTPAKK